MNNTPTSLKVLTATQSLKGDIIKRCQKLLPDDIGSKATIIIVPTVELIVIMLVIYGSYQWLNG